MMEIAARAHGMSIHAASWPLIPAYYDAVPGIRRRGHDRAHVHALAYRQERHKGS